MKKLLYKLFCIATGNKYVIVKAIHPYSPEERAKSYFDSLLFSLWETGPVCNLMMIKAAEILTGEMQIEAFGLDNKINERVKYFKQVDKELKRLCQTTDLKAYYLAEKDRILRLA